MQQPRPLKERNFYPQTFFCKTNILESKQLLILAKKLPISDMFYAIQNTDYSKSNLLIYTQPVFVFHLQGDHSRQNCRIFSFSSFERL